MVNIPLIIPNFNQLSYLINLVNQFHFYYPSNKIYVVDNHSDYKPLLDYYWHNEEIEVHRYAANDFVGNLTHFLEKLDSEYFCLSDPDISIHVSTPPNFLEIFKAIIDLGVHHVGFDLIYDDIPEWNKKAGWIAGDEKALHSKEYIHLHDSKGDILNITAYKGFKAPIDTTLALYCKSNGGWSAPMKPEHWDNSVRMFKAFHSSWYLHPDHLNEEMSNYFATCLKRDDSKPSAGRNHFHP